jgi:HK97 family phage major capsid protein
MNRNSVMENNQATVDDVREAKEYAFNVRQRTLDQVAREGRTPTPSELATIKRANDEALALERRVGAAQSERSFTEAMERRIPAGMMPDTREVRGNSLGARFARERGEWIKDRRNRPSGNPWTSAYLELDDPRFSGGFGGDVHATTLTTGVGTGGALVVPQYLPGIVPVPLRKPVVADLLGVGPASSNLIIYMAETAYTVNAAAVAEGATKPESGITFTQVSEPVQKLAHFIPVTDELLEDVPAIAAYVDQRLILGLQVVEDDQLLNGSGTPPNLTGLLARTGLAPDQPRGTDTNVDAIAKQIAAIETANPGVKVTGIIMHPTNWQTSRLMKNTLGDYLGGNPFAPVMTPALWGLPVAVTVAIPVGTALVVCKEAATVWRRGGINMAASNSHQDFFIKNLVAIRCEERLALAVYRASCFGRVTGLN